MDRTSDVVIVGGGIAGAAMAATLGRAGLDVLVLERQAAYRDRVRGELMMPWGVAEAQRLGLLQALVEAGGHWVTSRVAYDETIAPEAAEATALPLDRLLPGVAGALTFFHPNACAALSGAASAAGAEVLMGVRSVVVTGGDQPHVAYETDDSSGRVRCRLVIGADGRTSGVRAQAGIPLMRLAAEHLISGVLVEGASAYPDHVFALGTERDVTFVVCPQGSGRARLYLCHGLRPHDRFAGPGGPTAFLDAYHLTAVPDSDVLATAAVAGPCATLEGDETWTSQPFVEGVALIGDAAGYNNPLIGQGLSLAMRDVRIVSELLVSSSDWSPRVLEPYAVERAERMRRVRAAAVALASLHTRYTGEAATRRRAFRERTAADRTLALPLIALYAGPETAPAEAFTPDSLERLVGASVVLC